MNVHWNPVITLVLGGNSDITEKCCNEGLIHSKL